MTTIAPDFTEMLICHYAAEHQHLSPSFNVTVSFKHGQSRQTIVRQHKAIVRLYMAIIRLYKVIIRQYKAIIRPYRAMTGRL